MRINSNNISCLVTIQSIRRITYVYLCKRHQRQSALGNAQVIEAFLDAIPVVVQKKFEDNLYSANDFATVLTKCSRIELVLKQHNNGTLPGTQTMAYAAEDDAPMAVPIDSSTTEVQRLLQGA